MEVVDVTDEDTNESENLAQLLIGTTLTTRKAEVSPLSKANKSLANSRYKNTNAAQNLSTPRLPTTTSVPVDKVKTSKPAHKVPIVVSLNVGGVYYTTLRTTLHKYPDTMLAAMFSGRHELQTDSRGAYFIDRNGQYFGYILEFLRSGTLPTNDVALGVLMEARYYGLMELEERMYVFPSISAMIVRENHRAQFPDYQEVKKRVVQIAMENATVTKTGEVLIYAFRTEFVPKAPNFNINHHCSADQAHISVGPWESMADEDTLIKCLESDLIDEHFNIRVHDGKRRCKYFYGQSCQKCLFRLQIMFG